MAAAVQSDQSFTEHTTLEHGRSYPEQYDVNDYMVQPFSIARNIDYILVHSYTTTKTLDEEVLLQQSGLN